MNTKKVLFNFKLDYIIFELLNFSNHNFIIGIFSVQNPMWRWEWVDKSESAEINRGNLVHIFLKLTTCEYFYSLEGIISIWDDSVVSG